MKRVYLDNAATTKIDPRVLEVMVPALRDNFGNPSSIYAEARTAKKALEEARAQVAGLIGAKAGEVIFTGGGSEADNMALRGIAEAYGKKGGHIITSKVEHHAILHTCEYLQKQGFAVTYLPVDEFGLTTPEDVKQAIRPDTILISIMYANNEVGTIMPIREIGAIARERKILFHTDAVQAAGHVDIDVERDNIDLLSLTAHKIQGPKGVGALYLRKGVKLPPLIHGGGQERGFRAGTENLPGAVALGKACELAGAELEKNNAHMEKLRDYLLDGIFAKIPYVKLNGHPKMRLSNNVNVSVRYIEGEGMLLRLDMAGISASSGSACTSGSLDPSHVLLAMGLDHATAHGSLRLTLSPETSKEDIDYLLEKLPPIAEFLRVMSPVYKAEVGVCGRQELKNCAACPVGREK
ncbi:MAG: cysteine desulfurase NifS [Acidaminococcales bacterium]|jgi:cysteine desulfurase|nr:cysteine desulfurase NifS [Acidaminococcales bacterium]